MEIIRGFGAAALLALSLLAAAPARAEEPAGTAIGEDEVTLKNGGMIRGTVVGMEPGSKVVVQEVGAAEPRTIPWAEVADVERGKYKSAATATATAAVVPGQTPAGYGGPDSVVLNPNRPGMVRLHVESPEPVRVIEHLGTSYAQGGGYAIAVQHSQAICGTPCDTVIDGTRGQQFVVVGDGVPESEPFVLSDRQGDASLYVDPGSTGMQVGGAWMGGIGIIAMLTGGVFLLTGALVAETDTTGSASGMGDDFMLAGGISLGAGTALLGGGIALMIAGSTDVNLQSTPAPQTGSTKPARVEPRYWRGEF